MFDSIIEALKNFLADTGIFKLLSKEAETISDFSLDGDWWKTAVLQEGVSMVLGIFKFSFLIPRFILIPICDKSGKYPLIVVFRKLIPSL